MHEGDYPKTWTDVPRSKLFEEVIISVDGARTWALESGDRRYADYVDNVLFPFLEAELQKAEAEEE